MFDNLGRSAYEGIAGSEALFVYCSEGSFAGCADAAPKPGATESRGVTSNFGTGTFAFYDLFAIVIDARPLDLPPVGWFGF